MKVIMTVTVEPKKVTVTIDKDGTAVSSSMVQEGPGHWKGTEKASIFEEALADLFEGCDDGEIGSIADDLSSRGIDMHNELMLAEDA